MSTRHLFYYLIVLLGVSITPLAEAQPTPPGPAALAIDATRDGNFTAAIQRWNELLEVTALSDDVRYRSLIQRGEAYRALGFHSKAVTDLEAALALARRTENQVWIALAQEVLGNVYVLQQRFVLAYPLLQDSLKLAEKLKLPVVASACAQALGNLDIGLGRVEAARTWYTHSLAAARETDDALLKATARLGLARVEKAPHKALEQLRSAYADSHNAPANAEQASLQIAIGTHAQRLAEPSNNQGASAQAFAYQALIEGEETARKLGNRRLLSLAKGRLAALYGSQGRNQEALRLTEEAIATVQGMVAHDLLLQWESQLGQLLRTVGDRQRALAAYRRAVYHIQQIRMDIPIVYNNGRSSFRETLEPTYLGLTDLLLRQAADAGDDTRTQGLLREARDTVEILKSAELRDYYKDPCLTAGRTSAVDIEEIAPRSAVLYPIILPDRLELLVSMGTHLERTSVTVPGAKVDHTARRLAKRLRSVTRTGKSLPYALQASQLYRWLIAPIAPSLESHGIDTLVFVPDGALRMVPISALRNENGFLVERYAVVTVPGMTLLDPSPLKQGKVTTLLAGLSEQVQNVPSLPGVAAEIDSISRMLPATVLLDENFTKQRFESNLANTPYRIIHIASHGRFSGSPEESYILTFDDRIDMNELERILQSQATSASPIELLTLSACETAQGDDRSPLGLSGVALRSGARSALGSLWPVQDDAARQLIPEFYRHLKQGSSKAKALQRAQITLLQDRRFRHPHFWSPFILVGNWL